MAKFYVIAVGGTGMRCLESLVHLCAIGMFPESEIDILTIDTDYSNGNKNRTIELIEEAYNKITDKEHLENGFFSAKLNLFTYHPNHSDSGRKNLFDLCKIMYEKDNNEDKYLADLFFTEEQQKLNLNHGYRAQTNLGSFLMYHSLIECIIEEGNHTTSENHGKGLYKYFDNIFKDDGAKVFILGSIFGGTGASAIPILPKVIEHAKNIIAPNTGHRQTYGAAILSNYFHFSAPKEVEKQNGESIIADSHLFSLNSHAALKFYVENETVKNSYSNLYHIGWPKDFGHLDVSSGSKTKTGGSEQRNPSHIIELFTAFAAHDFFFSKNKLKNSINESKKTIHYHYASVRNKDKIDFSDFTKVPDFKQNLAAMYTIGLLTMVRNESGMGYWCGRLTPPITIDSTKIDALHKYFKFFMPTEQQGELSGWLYQLKKSIGDRIFLFENTSYAKELRDLEKINPGCLIDKKWGMKKNIWGTQIEKDRNDIVDEFTKRFVSKSFNNNSKALQIVNNLRLTAIELYQGLK